MAIPYKCGPDLLGEIIRNADRDTILELYQEIIQLNPSLERIKRSNSLNYFEYDIVYGTLSRFRYEEIDFFTKLYMGFRSCPPNYIYIENLLTKELGSLGWVPAPKTMGIICCCLVIISRCIFNATSPWN